MLAGTAHARWYGLNFILQAGTGVPRRAPCGHVTLTAIFVRDQDRQA